MKTGSGQDTRASEADARPALIDRKEFFNKAYRLAGGIILAGGLGAALAGCGETSPVGSTSQDNAPQTGASQQPAQAAPAPAAPPTASNPQTGTIDPAVLACRFYDNGNCKRTGGACTQCILR